MRLVMGSSINFLYLVIDSPVTGWMTGAQKCLHNHGMAWDVVGGAYVWSAIADSAAWEYSRGVRRAMRGDLRGAVAVCVSVGSSVGVDASVGKKLVVGVASVGKSLVVGVPLGSHVGGTLCRVNR